MAFQIIDDRAAFERDKVQRSVISSTGQSEEEEEWDYEPEPEDALDPDVYLKDAKDLINIRPSEFTEFAIQMPNKEEQTYSSYSFKDREYLRAVYDTPNKRTLLKCGRQVEKCCSASSTISLFDGSTKKARDIEVGDWVLTMAADGMTLTKGRVTWVSGNYSKPCLKIKSGLGYSTDVATTHPLRTRDSWTEAGSLNEGSRVAVVCGKKSDSYIYWDKIVNITDIGIQECVDFEVEGTHNFVCDGFITHNSTLLGNKLLSYSCIITALNSLYVSPTQQQTKVFSQDRLKEPIETSEYLKAWTTTKLSDNVLLKKFINRSQITLRYAFMNADRIRGIPADCITLDELQDLLTDSIHVIEECASHSPYKIFIYSGTPKSLDNTMEHYWTSYSTQNEWVVPCDRHTLKGPAGTSKIHWNILSEDNIGEKSLVCDRCHKPIFANDSRSMWAALNPEIIKSISKPYEGYRIPQLMVPWVTHEEILQKQKTYSRAKFYNEVLGLSYDSGTRPLTQQDLKDNCNSNISMGEAYQSGLRSKLAEATPVYAGLDWGGGSALSQTVITLGSYLPDGKFNCFFYHRFEGREAEPGIQIEEVTKIINLYKVVLVGCDYGGGFWPNDELTRRFGWQRIIKYQYSTPDTKVKWNDGLKRFMVHRTEVMSDIFNAIKRRDVFRFPNWDEFKNPFGMDFLNIFSEYNEQRRMDEYKKSPNVTDDSFHSTLLCFLASMIRHPRPDVMAPNSHPQERENHG